MSYCYPDKICFIKQRPARLPRNAVVLAPCQPQVCQPQVCAPTFQQACPTPSLPPCTDLITPRYADFGSNAITVNTTSGFSTAVLSLIINGPTNANPLLTTNASGGINIPFTGRYEVTYGANVTTPASDGSGGTLPPSPAISAFLSPGTSAGAFPGSIAPVNFGSQLDSSTTPALMGSVSNTSIVDFSGVSPSAPGALYLMFDAPASPAVIPFMKGTVPFPIKLTLRGPLHSTVPPVSTFCQPICTTVGVAGCC